MPNQPDLAIRAEPNQSARIWQSEQSRQGMNCQISRLGFGNPSRAGRGSPARIWQSEQSRAWVVSARIWQSEQSVGRRLGFGNPSRAGWIAGSDLAIRAGGSPARFLGFSNPSRAGRELPNTPARI
ncbi:hypothetical protein QUF72_15995 [Desulfobacterales bacterium HSG2]|nr:hypothetical protein [Desulfobacterales bacterium HSG2]